ncbi:Mur ligase [Mycena sp. CBHHK59/15]|nr:Mur ligase [Mycena sp. CBHHK59/15]
MSIDLTLDRIRRLVLHLPTYTRPTCHIAGTNGKGSVSALVSSMLSTSTPPLSIGRFNSPHLVSVHDCIVINNEAALDFEQAKLDVVVLEVGMGGRLDATNIISDECVLVSALTAVDLDHQAFLGNSVSAISAEKASIARRGKPFVLGDQIYPAVEEAVAKVVNAAGAELLYVLPVLSRPWDVSVDGQEPPPFSLSASASPLLRRCLFEHPLDNLGLAVSVVSAVLMNPAWASIRGRFTNDSIALGIKNVRWPGRLPLVVLADGAHNPGSSKTLAAYLSHLSTLLQESPSSAPRPICLTYILALSHSPPKTPLETLSPLLPFKPSAANIQATVNVALLHFTPPDGMPWVKSVPPSDLQEVVKSLAPGVDTWTGPWRRMTARRGWLCSRGSLRRLILEASSERSGMRSKEDNPAVRISVHF